jgi:hypothetical protein
LAQHESKSSPFVRGACFSKPHDDTEYYVCIALETEIPVLRRMHVQREGTLYQSKKIATGAEYIATRTSALNLKKNTLFENFE